MSKTIKTIKLFFEHDPTAELDFLGEYGNSPKEGAIDRKERGGWQSREFRYFNPENPEYAEESYARMESYNEGQWTMVTAIAKAEIVVNSIRGSISVSIGGIESDSDKDYQKDVFDSLLDDLFEVLLELGFSKKQVKTAIEDTERD